MINQQNKYIRFLKSDRFILFLSIFIASGWWILLNLSKGTSRNISAKVRFECPIGYIFQSLPPQDISISISGEAWEVIRAARKIRSTTFSIPLKALQVQYLTKNDLSYYVNEQIDISQVNIDINAEGIPFELVTSKRRKIPLVLLDEIPKLPGLQMVGLFKLKPDSLVVTGPSDIIDSLTSWPIIPLASIDKDGTFDIMASPKPSNTFLLTIPSQEVRIRGKVDSYTQKIIMVNLNGENEDYEIMPSNIEVTCKVALSYFEQASQKEIDYELIPISPPSYYLALHSNNPALYIINYSPRKVVKYKRIELTSAQ